MRSQAFEFSEARSDLSDLFDLRGEASQGASWIRDFELHEEELFWWLMPQTSRVSRAMRASNVRQIAKTSLANPLELFRLIGSYTMAARSLAYPIQSPAYWVRRGGEEGVTRYFRPALPESQLSDFFQVPVRQIRPALQPLISDGAIELVRSPSGVLAALMMEGFVAEDRLRARLRA